MAPKAPPILIVDDNVEFASLLGTLFAEQGLVPILAHTAANAQTLAKVYSPSAVVVDLLLPDMTGHKLLGALKGSTPHLFVITGVFKGQGQMERVRAIAKIQGWYEKPFDTRLLVEQVMKVVGQPVVARKEHRFVEQITGDFDINILDPADEGIRAASGPKPKAQGGDELDLDIAIEEPGVDESSQQMWQTVARAEEMAIEVEDLGPDLEHDGGVEIEMPDSNPRGGITLDSAQTAPAFPKLEPVRTAGPGPSTKPAHPRTQVDGASTAPPRPAAPAPAPAEVDRSKLVAGLTSPVTPGAPVDLASDLRVRTAPGFTRERTASGFSRELSPSPADFRAGLRAKMRTGPIRSATAARLLTAFHVSQETGEIAFENNDQRKVVYFYEGRPVYARSNQDADRIGAVARRAFGLSQQQIERALEVARKTDRMLGEVLLEQGVLPEGSRNELVKEQTRTIIRSLLTWGDGRYVIGFNVSSEIQRAELNEHPAALVMNGVRELFDLERLRKLVPDRMRPMPSPNAPYELHELPMRDNEAVLLLRSTGTRTVRNLLDELKPRLDEQGVRALIYGLLVLGILFSGRAQQLPPAVQPVI